MPFFRKRPVVVEARRFEGTAQSAEDIIQWANGMVSGIYDEDKSPYLAIKTIDSIGRAYVGDWVIRGVSHEYYPCKNDILGFTYEEVEPE